MKLIPSLDFSADSTSKPCVMDKRSGNRDLGQVTWQKKSRCATFKIKMLLSLSLLQVCNKLHCKLGATSELDIILKIQFYKGRSKVMHSFTGSTSNVQAILTCALTIAEFQCFTHLFSIMSNTRFLEREFNKRIKKSNAIFRQLPEWVYPKQNLKLVLKFKVPQAVLISI